MSIPPYVGMTKLCELIDMSDDTVRRRMRDDGFPKPKPSGKWKWSEVEAWMDGKRDGAIASPGGDDQIREIKDASAAYFASRH